MYIVENDVEWQHFNVPQDGKSSRKNLGGGVPSDHFIITFDLLTSCF